MFDKFEDYIIAKQPALDKAGPNGLELDDMVAKVGDDFEHLYSGSPFQFNVNETIIKPVMRPEHKLFKVTQFVKKMKFCQKFYLIHISKVHIPKAYQKWMVCRG